MYYFVPAWYPPQRTWYDNTDRWYFPRLRIDFDDIINQMRMFQHAEIDSTLLVLNYMPNLRYFTHRYDLSETPAFSVFDWIQNTHGTTHQPIDFHQLSWPSNVEFYYSPFLIVAKVEGETLAHIEFGESGQLILIDYWQDGVKINQYIFDDRGFLSSIKYMENGEEAYQDYLDSLGQWQIREDLTGSQKVYVNPQVAHRFRKPAYNSIEELVQEGLEVYLAEEAAQDDVLLVAADQRHFDVIKRVKGNRQMVLSFFQNRIALEDKEVLKAVLDGASVLVADKLSTTAALSQQTVLPVEHISPFDSRLSLGKSQRMKELEVYFQVDQLSEEDRDQLLELLFDEMRRNEWIRLKVVTYQEGPAVQNLKVWLEEQLELQSEDYLSLDDEDNLQLFELELSEDDIKPPRVSFLALRSETAIMTAMETARLIVDLSEEPDLYTQIAAISAGIPQINRRESEFAEHLKNAYIVEDISRVSEATRYYLDGLANWNKALVYAVQKIADYTSGRLVNKLLSKLEN